MARIVFLLSLIGAAALPACGGAAASLPAQNSSSSNEDAPLVQAIGHPPSNEPGGDPERFTCSIKSDVVSVTSSGAVTWSHSGGRTIEATVPRPSEAQDIVIEKLWCGAVGRDLVLLHQARCYGPSGDFIKGGLVRMAASSGLVKWLVPVEGNTGEPLRVGQFLYVTGIGFVGKIDMESGRYLWQVSGLFREPGMYNSFEKPQVEGGRVAFRPVHQNFDKPIPDSWPKFLVVDDRSGSVLQGGR